MKTLILIFLTTTFATAQNVLRVNNTPGSAAPYTTLAAAITAAGTNDIILLEGSDTNYGDLTITKKVTIIGPGYFLLENQNLQASHRSASVGMITLNSGSNGTAIAGLVFYGQPGLTINGVSNISLTNSVIESCKGILITGNGNNVLIRNNYKSSFCQSAIECTGSYTSVIVTNNFFETDIRTGSTSTFTIENNTFGNGTGFLHDLQNSDVRNNIFLYSFPPIANTTGSTIKNNAFQAPSQSGADGTNIFNQSVASLFLGLSGNTTDTQWRLKAGSPAIGAGIGGVDCGMYGGATPYRPSGIQAGQHTVYSLSVPATVIQNGTLNVKVSAKVN